MALNIHLSSPLRRSGYLKPRIELSSISAVVTLVTAMVTIATIAIVTIAWRRFQVLDNLHFFVLILCRHFHKFHTSLDIFSLSILLDL